MYERRGRGLTWRLAGGAVLVQAWVVAALSGLVNTAAAAARRAREARGSEEGQALPEYLAMGALGVVTIVALWAVLRALGFDIIEKIRENILGGG